MSPEQYLLLLLLTLNIFHTLFYYYYCWIWTKVNTFWVWEYIVSDNQFVFSNCEKYILLWVGKFCWVTFSSILTQNKVAKGYLLMTALQKDKSNPVNPALLWAIMIFFKFMVSCEWAIQEKIQTKWGGGGWKILEIFRVVTLPLSLKL